MVERLLLAINAHGNLFISPVPVRRTQTLYIVVPGCVRKSHSVSHPLFKILSILQTLFKLLIELRKVGLVKPGWADIGLVCLFLVCTVSVRVHTSFELLFKPKSFSG